MSVIAMSLGEEMLPSLMPLIKLQYPFPAKCMTQIPLSSITSRVAFLSLKAVASPCWNLQSRKSRNLQVV